MAVLLIPPWKASPFIRLLLPFVAGIVYRYYSGIGALAAWIVLGISLLGVFIFSFSSLSTLFKKRWIFGLLLNGMLMGLGSLIMHYNDSSSAAEQIKTRPYFIVSIKEPLSEKKASWKALVFLDHPKTNLLLYFRKDSTLELPGYGNRILFTKLPKEIENIPLFGSFDYKKYCALKHIHYQVFLNKKEFIVLPGKTTNWFNDFLFRIQKWVLHVLKEYIPGKKECGLAEALLIGYKDDLDRSLINSYSNTGVIHVVAISGLHLGLIYALLKYLCIPFGKKRFGRVVTPLIIICGLWTFSLLAGGSPSVLRSAVMFTSIVAGEFISRRSPIINNLAVSAFFLLCCNPYWLWDIGFQLSYAALFSIVIFMKPIFHAIIIKNKIVDSIWKLNAVTLAATILTTPLTVYYFHQFPVLFLITNFIAVPLSSVILMGEIVLCAVSPIPLIAKPVGMLLHWFIRFMNGAVEYLDGFPFSSVRGLNINFIQLVLMYLIISCIAGWLLLRNKRWLFAALISAILFFVINALWIWGIDF